VAKDILKVLRTDKTANWGSTQELADWHKSMETDAFAEQFTAAMDCRGIYLAQAAARKLDFSQHHHLLDIAGGSAIYACSFLAHHPHLHATVLEKPPVDRIAAKAIEKRGFTDRINVHAADMLTDALPTHADVHLYSNVLHDWDLPEVKQLLQASFQALPSGGMLVVHDAFLNEDKSGPQHVADYSVMLMHATQGRCYSMTEIELWASECGFHTFHYQETAAARGVLTALK
jgi:predicted O-methyltransferase YrrM